MYSYTLSLVFVANMWSVLSCSQHWNDLCKVAFSTNWYKTDAKDGITVSRSRFGRGVGRHAVIKIEGFLNHTPETILQFLQITMKPGGKLDYFFRNEFLVDRIQGSYHTTYVRVYMWICTTVVCVISCMCVLVSVCSGECVSW